MTHDEILALTDEELIIKAQAFSGRRQGKMWSDPVHDLLDAWWLFEEIYNKKSPLHGGAWVLGTVSDGKDCSQATLLLHLPWRARIRKGMKAGKVDPVDKFQATTKKGEMARAITLVYVTAMEDAK